MRVLSRHRHACNLVTEEGNLVAVVAAHLGNGPFHIVVPDSAFAIFAHPARVVRIGYRDGCLRWPGGILDMCAATVWDPRVTWPSHAPDPHLVGVVGQTLRRSSWNSLFADAAPFPASMQHRAQEGMHCLSRGLRTGHMTEIERDVHLLAGLGPGLTPAGDDFLLGVMAALWTFQPCMSMHLPVENVCTRIGALAAPRTTQLSAAWLRHAARGEFSGPWHDLARALRSADARAVESTAQRILAVGATSGADALWGFVTVAQSIGGAN